MTTINSICLCQSHAAYRKSTKKSIKFHKKVHLFSLAYNITATPATHSHSEHKTQKKLNQRNGSKNSKKSSKKLGKTD